MSRRRRRRHPHPEILARVIRIASIDPSVFIHADKPRGLPPRIESHHWLELRGWSDEPLGEVYEFTVHLHVDERREPGPVVPPAIGSILRVNPMVAAVMGCLGGLRPGVDARSLRSAPPLLAGLHRAPARALPDRERVVLEGGRGVGRDVHPRSEPAANVPPPCYRTLVIEVLAVSCFVFMMLDTNEYLRFSSCICCWRDRLRRFVTAVQVICVLSGAKMVT